MDNSNKFNSRKFIVWVTWLVVTFGAIIIIGIISINNKELSEAAGNIIHDVIKYFFGVSMLYLGANAGQKAVLALAEKKEDEDKEEEEK